MPDTQDHSRRARALRALVANQRVDLKIAALDYYCDELAAAGRYTPTVRSAAKKARQIRLTHRWMFYIAGALTGVDQTTKDRYKLVSELVGKYKHMFGYAPHMYGTDPVRHPGVTAEEVRDINYVFAAVVADVHINFWHPVAHGNAIEAGWAEEAKIPSLYLVPAEQTLSRLARGMNNVIDTIVYQDFSEDGLLQIDSFLKQI